MINSHSTSFMFEELMFFIKKRFCFVYFKLFVLLHFLYCSFNKQLAQMGKIKTFSHSQPGVCSYHVLKILVNLSLNILIKKVVIKKKECTRYLLPVTLYPLPFTLYPYPLPFTLYPYLISLQKLRYYFVTSASAKQDWQNKMPKLSSSSCFQAFAHYTRNSETSTHVYCILCFDCFYLA